MYRNHSAEPLPPDVPIKIHRGECFEAQKDGRYGSIETLVPRGPQTVEQEVSALVAAGFDARITMHDLGTEIGVEGGTIQSLDSRVSYVGPGRPCLRCTNVITEEAIRLEGLATEERRRVINMGYSTDTPLEAPSVMDLNMRAASTAMLWIRHLLQPLLAGPLPHALKESVTNFGAKHVRYRSVAGCNICDEPMRLGSGDRFRLTTREPVEATAEG